MKKILVGLILGILLVVTVSAQLTNPTVYYKFNEPSSARQAIDYLGLSNLTLNKTDSAWFNGLFLNNVLKINSTANGQTTMNTSNSASFAFGTGTFTVAFWVNGTNSAGSYVTIQTDQSNANGWGITQANNAGVFGWVSNNVEQFNTSISVLNNSWNRVVFSREGTGANQMRIFVNNNNIRNVTYTEDLSLTTGSFRIGGPNGGNGVYLDDLRIYNGYAWNATDVNTDFNGGQGQELNPISNITTTLIAPPNNYITINSSINFSASIFSQSATNQNITLFVWHSNGTLFNSTTNSIIGVNTTNTTSFVINNFNVIGNYLWNVYSCGTNATATLCAIASSNRSFIFGSSTNTNSFNLSTYETAFESFTTNMTIGSGVLSSVYLYYNNTVYLGTSTSIGGNDYLFSRSIDIPLGAAINNWFWSLRFSNGVNINTSSNTQTVGAINLSACGGAPQNVPYFNFTMKEEGTFNLLNASLESIWSYWLGSGSVNRSMLFSNITDGKSNYGFCFSPQNRTVYITGINNYYKSGYDLRTFYFSNTSKTNSSGNIDLFLLSTATSDVVTFTVVDDFLNPLPNAEIRILRWDLVSDTFYLVNTLITDSSGQASSNLRLNDAFYVYMVSYQGTLYLTTAAAPQIATTRTFQIFLNNQSNVYTVFRNIQKSLVFDNSTNITTLTYTDPSNSISGMCLIVKKSTGVGTQVVTQLCSTSTASVLAIDLTPYGNGAYTIDARASYNTGTSIIYFTIDSLDVTIGVGQGFLTIGRAAQVISMVFIGTMAMIGVATGSIPLGIILVIAAFIVLYLFGFVNFTSGFVTTIVAMLVLISMSLQRRYQ